MDFITGFFKEHIIWTGAGAAAILFLLSRLIPKEKLAKSGDSIGIVIFTFLYDTCSAFFKGIGKTISLGGRSKFGMKFWEKIEDWIEATIDAFIGGFVKAWHSKVKHTCVLNCWWLSLREGWNYDNNVKENKEIIK